MSQAKKIFQRKSGPYFYWHVLNIIIIGFFALATLLTFFFVRENIYATMVNSSAIVAIKTSGNYDALDLNAFDAVEKMLKEKKSVKYLVDDLRNMFEYGSTTTKR